ncbi:MAG: homoserine dehydrogenase [bacterium]
MSCLKIAVAGLGTVGGQVVKRIIERGEKLSRRTGCCLQLVAAADVSKTARQRFVDTDINIYDDVLAMLDSEEFDVFVELIGGTSIAKKAVQKALAAGRDVVTANKEMLAKFGPEIFNMAAEKDCRIRFEASVGGSIPVVRTVREALVDAEFEAIYGIINGTCNYILSCMEEKGEVFSVALERAQQKGFAEADPTYDVEGDDSAHKIAVLASLAFGTPVPLESIYCEGIKRITPAIISDARRLGYRIKLLGIAKKTASGLDIRVHPTMVPLDSALAAVGNEYNAVYLESDPLGASMLYGKGAGGPATATAVIADLISLYQEPGLSSAPGYFADDSLTPIEEEKIKSRYYIRLNALDQPGVLAGVTRILGEKKISIETVIQHGRSADQEVPVILTTHRAREGNMRRAIEEIKKLPVIGDRPAVVRIEEELGEK